MADFVNILKEQIEEGRKSSISSARDSRPSSRHSIQKKKLVPLEEPAIEQSENNNKKEEQPKKVMIEMETSPIFEELDKKGKKVSVFTEPENPKPFTKEEIEPEQTDQVGGALWEAPKDLGIIRSSMKELPNHEQPKEKSLFDLVMEPPKKELQPTLFTYFDKLMQMGEV